MMHLFNRARTNYRIGHIFWYFIECKNRIIYTTTHFEYTFENLNNRISRYLHRHGIRGSKDGEAEETDENTNANSTPNLSWPRVHNDSVSQLRRNSAKGTCGRCFVKIERCIVCCSPYLRVFFLHFASLQSLVIHFCSESI